MVKLGNTANNASILPRASAHILTYFFCTYFSCKNWLNIVGGYVRHIIWVDSREFQKKNLIKIESIRRRARSDASWRLSCARVTLPSSQSCSFATWCEVTSAYSLGDYLRLDAISITSLDSVIFSLPLLHPSFSSAKPLNVFQPILSCAAEAASKLATKYVIPFFSHILCVCVCMCVLCASVCLVCAAHDTQHRDGKQGKPVQQRRWYQQPQVPRGRQCPKKLLSGSARAAQPLNKIQLSYAYCWGPEGSPHECTETTTRAVLLLHGMPHNNLWTTIAGKLTFSGASTAMAP